MIPHNPMCVEGILKFGNKDLTGLRQSHIIKVEIAGTAIRAYSPN